MVLKFINAAVATSGDYRRYIIIRGKRHSHIINRKTGDSSNKLDSVTIIGKSATKADGLATAVSVMGAKKGLSLIETMPDTEAILITLRPKYKLIESSGARKYIKQ